MVELSVPVEKLIRMNKFTCDAIIRVISKRPEFRSRREIEIVLPFVSWRTNCLRNIDKELAIEILKEAEYQRFKRDQIIIKQGGIGDAFYVIIRGSVSVYRNEEMATKRSETFLEDSGKLGIPTIRSRSTSLKLKRHVKFSPVDSREIIVPVHIIKPVKAAETPNLNREQYGNRINSLGTGKSFGEIALIYPNTERNATVIADDAADVLVISRELFNKKIKEHQDRELEERKAFIAVHPFFCKWTEQNQKELQKSLVKTTCPVGTPIIRQGDKVSGLKFILSGRAKLSAEPEKHEKQYPDLFEWSRMGQLEEDIWRHLEEQKIPACSSLFTEDTHVRRSKGYAEAEKNCFGKSIEISFVDGGEIFNDLELILGLDTHVFRVFCSTPCEVYTMDARTFDKLVVQKNPHTLQMMKIAVQEKLYNRMISPPGLKLELLHILHSKLHYFRIDGEQEVEEQAAQLPLLLPALNNTNRKHRAMKHNREATLEWYTTDKASYLKPFTIGPIFYKELMQKRTREKRRKHENSKEYNTRNACRRISDAILLHI